MIRTLIAGAAPLALLAAAAPADYVITQQADAPAAYTDHDVNFDEPGAPSNVVINGDEYLASDGITFMSGLGDGGYVGDLSGFYPWINDGQAYLGGFGTFLTFDTGVTGMALQAWDGSGPPSPFGGGMGVILFSGGVEVAFEIFEPAWGGVGDTWFNIQATEGDTFDEVRLINFGFSDGVAVDNLSWNVVPAPGALALLGMGLVGTRRRRA